MKIRNKFISLLLAALLLPAVLLPAAAAPADSTEDGGADMWIAAGSALLYDVDNDIYLYEQNADGRMYPAALVKTMTLLLIAEAIERGEMSLTDTFTVTSSLLEGLPYGGNTLGMKEGDILTVDDLLYCATVGSANEACVFLAVAMAGSEAAFVARMNQRAEELGCTGTHFTNPHGLHSANQYTTARDMLLITREGLRHELFRSYVACTQYIVQSEQYSGRRYLYTANYLLSGKVVPGYTYPYANGVRTGYTSEAGNCLIASATRGNRTLVAVILNARNGSQGEPTYMLSFREGARLLDWGYTHFAMRTLVRQTELLQELHVELARDNDYVVLHPAEDVIAMVPSDIPLEEFERTITLNDELIRAPVEAGEVLGQLTVSANGEVYGTVDLLALASVDAMGVLGTMRRVTLFFLSPAIRFLALLVLLVALILTIRGLRRERRSRKPIAPRRNNVSYLDDARRTQPPRRR